MTKKLEQDLLKGVPFGYLTQSSEFYHQRFFINESVLIPRPETELMVDLLVEQYAKKPRKETLDVLDVGTGSGVILLSLLNLGVGKKGLGVDISPEALKIAQINSHRLRLNTKASFTISDRLSNVEGEFDLIVSNPPYIKASSHRSLVHENVDAHEPKLALYLPDVEYQEWFHVFFTQVKQVLKSQGVFMMEGHELELAHQKSMLDQLGFQSVKVLQDYTGRDRFLTALQS